MTKFVIVSPRQNCGGAIVLHKLCDLLKQKGYKAKIFYSNTVADSQLLKNTGFGNKIKFWTISIIKFLKDFIKIVLGKLLSKSKFKNKHFLKGYGYVPIKSIKRKFIPHVDKDTIVIYPEVCYGNFLNAKKIVRYFLFHNKYKNQENAFGKDDLFISYRKVFNDYKLNPDCKIVYISNFDEELYKQTNFKKREGNCYIIRKGSKRDDLPKDFDGPILDSLSEEDIVKAFNKYKYCICYDTQTFYSSIAAYCGCISVVIPEKGKGREDYVSDSGGYGVAYGLNDKEIEFATNTKDLLINQLKGINEESEHEVNKFIMYCSDYFGGKINLKDE